MRVLSQASIKGDGAVNEDITGAAAPLAWIFDGATATGPAEIPGADSDAAWLAHRLDRTIRRLATDPAPLPDLAAHLIDDVRRGLADLGLPRDRITPYASGALLRVRDDVADYLLLGDVTLAHHDEAITDPRAAQFAEAAIDLATRYHGEELRHHQRDFERAYVNNPDGYWVFGSHPAAAEHALTGRIPLTEPTLILLATDGLARAVDTFDLAPSWPALIDQLATAGPDAITALITQLRALEHDPARAAIARIKDSDDATGLLLRTDQPA
jgi:hypothetical protein